MSASPPLAKFAARLLAEIDPRAKSLLVTIWGDTIFPRGGAAWLGGLIDLARPFGVSERLVRTSVQRLTREDWLFSTRLGRRSRYDLTASGHRRFEDARRRIFAPAPADWDGRWLLVFTGLGRLGRGQREAVRRELLWLGFGVLAPNLFAHPAGDRALAGHVLRDLGVDAEVVVMTAAAEAAAGGGKSLAGQALLRDCWDLDGLAADYRAFLDRFGRAPAALAAASRSPGPGEGEGDGEACFVLRTLLVHEYRRILLRDPDLPAELLPADWTGSAARRLRGEVFRLASGSAEPYVAAILEDSARAASLSASASPDT